MRVHSLRTYDSPDVGDHLVHFTGRTGARLNVDHRIEALRAQERLLHILVDCRLRGFETFGAEAPVVCFTESTKAAMRQLIQEGRYEPVGLGFSKQIVFDRGGGPALYVRGDEWPAATAALPQPLRSRLVRLWPGADPEPGDGSLPRHLSRSSEWLHEREWRVPGDVHFSWKDVRFLIVPHARWQSLHASWISTWAGPEYGQVFSHLPAVVMDQTGAVLRDDSGIWA
jgi:hypothetical protein